jgi:methyl-accepting chemotaxis protein
MGGRGSTGRGRRCGKLAGALAAAPARPAAAPANDSEPERLRQLAEAAFAQSQAAPRRERPASPPAPVPARKVANARASDAGWEEF